MDKIDPTLMSYLKGPYGAASLPSLNDVNKMQLALPGYGGADSLGNYGAAADTSMATSYFNNFQLQQNKLPGMGMYGLPPFYGDFYGLVQKSSSKMPSTAATKNTRSKQFKQLQQKR